MPPSPGVAALDRDALAERIAALLAPRPEVLEAYLFGSHATGRAQPHSDIDVAVYVDEKSANDSGYGYPAELATVLMAGLLSHGEKRQLELAIALATSPKLLLLDEPLAGTGHEESERVVETLRRLKGRYTIVLIEHDMDAVFALADRVSVLVYGRVIATDTPERVRMNEAVRAAYLGEEAA